MRKVARHALMPALQKRMCRRCVNASGYVSIVPMFASLPARLESVGRDRTSGRSLQFLKLVNWPAACAQKSATSLRASTVESAPKAAAGARRLAEKPFSRSGSARVCRCLPPQAQ